MTDGRTEFFGTEAQRALLARGKALFDVVRGDPRFTYYGRTVGLATPEDGDPTLLRSLVALQGSAHFAAVDTDAIAELQSDAEAHGFAVTRYVRWSGAGDALDAARRVLAGARLPDGIEMVRITPETPEPVMTAFAQMALDCGVLPPVRSVLDGRDRSGLCLIARTPEGEVVSCAAGAAFADPAHPKFGDIGWWGMLATRPDHRGSRLSLILGAHALVGLMEERGLKSVFTGVVAGNAPSEAVCARMGLAPEMSETLSLADPGLLPGGRMTK